MSQPFSSPPPSGSLRGLRTLELHLGLLALLGFVLGLAGPTVAGEKADRPAQTYREMLSAVVKLEDGSAAVPEAEGLLAAALEAYQTAQEPLSAYFFGRDGYRGSRIHAPGEPQTTLLETLRTRRGPCLNLTLIYLALAEEIGVEAWPVVTPRHVFVREQRGDRTVNIEMLDGGKDHPDRYYLLQENADLDDPRAQGLLRRIGPEGLYAYFLNNRAVHLRASGDVNGAKALYEDALRLDDACEPCLYNYANLLAAEGKHKKARRLYDKALELHPWDEEARRNRGE